MRTTGRRSTRYNKDRCTAASTRAASMRRYQTVSLRKPLVRRSSRPRRTTTAQRSLKLEVGASSLALLGARALHADALVRAPDPDLGATGLAHPLNADAGVLPAGRRVRSAHHFPVAGLVGESVADLKLHRQDATLGGRCWLALLLGSRPSHSTLSPRMR